MGCSETFCDSPLQLALEIDMRFKAVAVVQYLEVLPKIMFAGKALSSRKVVYEIGRRLSVLCTAARTCTWNFSSRRQFS